MSNLKDIKIKVKNIKVLFVDDEEDIRNGMGTFLKKFFDDVTICIDGEDGLNTFIQNQDIQVVITDILMPKMDGYAMVEKIKEIKPDIFVIYITASKRDIQLSQKDKHTYLKKPLSFEDITEVIKMIGETL